MRKMLFALLESAVLLFLCACCINHTWNDATCIVPKTCSKCNATEGSAAGHSWNEATCTDPKTCSKCNATEGSAAGHNWNEATCIDPKTCSKCSATEGGAAGHSWNEATCIDPKTCSKCNATEGSAAGHSWNEATCIDPKTCSKCNATEGSAAGHSWNEATCTDPKICSKCATTEGTAIGHTFGIWEDILLPTCTSEGKRKHTCSACDFSEVSVQGELGHRWNPWKTLKEATTETTGYKERSCSVCDKIETEIIPVIQLSAEEKKKLALEVAWEIVDYIGEKGTDLERVAAAAEIVSIFCANCEYTTEGTDYREAYGVFIKGEYSCAGATRALGMVLDCMGIKWQHINENQWTHQWCEVTVDGKTGFADGMIGLAGYGEHPVVQSGGDFIIW